MFPAKTREHFYSASGIGHSRFRAPALNGLLNLFQDLFRAGAATLNTKVRNRIMAGHSQFKNVAPKVRQSGFAPQGGAAAQTNR